MSGKVGSQFTNSGVIGSPVLGEPASGVMTNLTGTLTSPTFVTPTLGTPASGTLTNTTAAPSGFTLSSVNNTNGASKAFTGIPSWHKFIYIWIQDHSVSGNDGVRMQLGYGSTSYMTSGYVSTCTNGIGAADPSAGFDFAVGSAGRSMHGFSKFYSL